MEFIDKSMLADIYQKAHHKPSVTRRKFIALSYIALYHSALV